LTPTPGLVSAHRQLTLFVEDEPGSSHLRVRLSEGKRVLVDHYAVRDSANEEYQAFVDADRYFENHWVPGVPDPLAEPTRRLGTWVSDALLGDASGVLAAAAPCTVVVTGAPVTAGGPWELALVGGRTLAEHGAVFAQVTGSTARPRPADGRQVLRVLAVFSQPDGLDALNLRKERRELQRAVGDLTARGAAVELRTYAGMAAADDPDGHGHRYSQESVDAWALLLRPADWTPADAEHLRTHIR
jgi:hypothetical protein